MPNARSPRPLSPDLSPDLSPAPSPAPRQPDAAPTPGTGTGRRELLTASLAGAALLALPAGCRSDRERGPGAQQHAESSAPARRLRAQAVRQSATLLASYQATLHAHPELADRLTPLRRAVAQHLRALRQDPATDGASPGGTPGQVRDGDEHQAEERAGRSAPPHRVPDEPRAALRALADAERRTADARLAALATAPPELARLLASVAAAGAAHAYLLTADA